MVPSSSVLVGVTEEKGKGTPQLYNYRMRDARVLKDGSIVASIEQYYVISRTYTDPRTGTSTASHLYYYNDIIAFKVGVSGGFDWLGDRLDVCRGGHRH